MTYRICKTFEIESGHMLSKHHERCRFPHGHSRRIEIVLASETLDANDMVCDFKAVKLALAEFLDRLDHAMAVNSADANIDAVRAMSERVIEFDGVDPTTEVIARYIFEFVRSHVEAGDSYTDAAGHEYRFPGGVRVERVRVWETSSSWAEYGERD